MVKAGHSWNDIQNYPLSTIGVFLRTAAVNEKQNSLTSVIAMWNANNLSHEGIKELIREYEKIENKGRVKKAAPEKVAAGWKGLANAFGTKKVKCK